MFHSVVDVSGKKKLAGKTMSQNNVFFFIMPAHGLHDHHDQSYYGHDYDFDPTCSCLLSDAAPPHSLDRPHLELVVPV